MRRSRGAPHSGVGSSPSGPRRRRPFRSLGGRDRREGHAAARQLLATRMDGLLTAAETRELADHLLACARCRSVARGYEETRELLTGMRPTVVPRDLGARVSAALDRVMAGPQHRLHLPDGLPRPGTSMLGPVAAGATAVVVLVVGARLLLAPAIVSRGTPAVTAAHAPAPTPFAVPVAELALVELGSDGLTVYQAAVSEMCPASAMDCATTDYESSPVLGIPSDLMPRGVAFDRASHRMALLAENALGADTVSVVVLPVMGDGAAPRGAGPGPDGRWRGPGAPPATGLASSSPRPVASGDPTDGETRVLAILDGVEAVGAPPAWSADGQMLAFSAMPADHSRGPDIYLWRPGQERARRVTTDHASWFASWSGSRIVVSRLPKGQGRDIADTLLVDPTTGREQDVRLGGAWLPSVDPSGRFAVAWRGTLTGGNAQVRPRTGGLALVDWQLVDPSAASATVVAVPRALRVGGRAPGAAARGSGGTGRRSDAKAPSPWLESIEAGTDDAPAALDWQVSWASSDTTFGYWVADARGASWGRLTVLRVEPDTRRIDRGTPLLGPTLARRSFTLGDDRIAWVAPADEGADGELHVRTWGDPGEGSLRFRGIRLRDGVPAF